MKWRFRWLKIPHDNGTVYAATLPHTACHPLQNLNYKCTLYNTLMEQCTPNGLSSQTKQTIMWNEPQHSTQDTPVLRQKNLQLMQLLCINSKSPHHCSTGNLGPMCHKTGRHQNGLSKNVHRSRPSFRILPNPSNPECRYRKKNNMARMNYLVNAILPYPTGQEWLQDFTPLPWCWRAPCSTINHTTPVNCILEHMRYRSSNEHQWLNLFACYHFGASQWWQSHCPMSTSHCRSCGGTLFLARSWWDHRGNFAKPWLTTQRSQHRDSLLVRPQQWSAALSRT